MVQSIDYLTHCIIWNPLFVLIFMKPQPAPPRLSNKLYLTYGPSPYCNKFELVESIFK